MLMNVIRLISSPFSDSKISNKALPNPPHAPFHLAVLLDEKIKALRSDNESISGTCEYRALLSLIGILFKQR